VKVDFELRGCPINKDQLIDVLSAFLIGRRPTTPSHSVCVECKLKGNICILVSQAAPCLGPVTHAGCGALCPSYNRGCYGCFGPKETPNALALSDRLVDLGMNKEAIGRLYSTFNVNAVPFLVRKSVMTRKTIKVDYLARVEGEGGLKVTIEEGVVRNAQLNIFEPPRFFEAFMRGRHYTETPDIVARIAVAFVPSPIK
jgi:hypothetical protein